MYYTLKARYDGVRYRKGEIFPEASMATREGIEELEQEFEAFKRLFDSSWSKAKKNIRKEYLWTRLKKSDIFRKKKKAEKTDQSDTATETTKKDS